MSCAIPASPLSIKTEFFAYVKATFLDPVGVAWSSVLLSPNEERLDRRQAPQALTVMTLLNVRQEQRLSP